MTFVTKKYKIVMTDVSRAELYYFINELNWDRDTPTILRMKIVIK